MEDETEVKANREVGENNTNNLTEEKLQINLDKLFKQKLDLMIRRIQDKNEQDNCMIVEGDTGSGKSNFAVGIAYLVSQETGREFNINHIFLDTKKMIDFAKTTREQIIIWDEPVYAGLKKEWWNKTQLDLIKLLYTARIKRHFLIFNIIKFSEFAPAIIERAVVMVRIYQRNAIHSQRRFMYFNQNKITKLMSDYKRTKNRLYNKHVLFAGTTFPYILPKIIDVNVYNKMKEDAIEQIGVKSPDAPTKERKLLNSYQKRLAELPKKLKQMGIDGVTQRMLAEAMEMSRYGFSVWKDYADVVPDSLGNAKESLDFTLKPIDNGLPNQDSETKQGKAKEEKNKQ